MSIFHYAMARCMCLFILCTICVAQWQEECEVNEVTLLQSDMALQTLTSQPSLRTHKHTHMRGSDTIQFISVETHDDRAFIPMLGVPGRTLRNLGAGEKWQGWKWRLEKYISYLETEAATNPTGLVVVTDVSDVVVGGCTDEILEQFYKDAISITEHANKSESPSVVFGATHAWRPRPARREDDYGMFLARHDLALQEIGISRNLYDGFVTADYKSTFGALSYLNFGLLMGPVGAVRDVFKGIHAIEGPAAEGFDPRYSDTMIADALYHRQEWNDQQAGHEYILNNPHKVTLDYTGRLFLNLGGLSNWSSIIKGANASLRNLVTGSVQCLCHFQGSAKGYMAPVLTEIRQSLQS